MRIGILTYHRSHNCGALLQAYALREFFKLKGYNDVTYVDYWPEYHKDVYRLFRKLYFRKQSLLGKFKFLIYLCVFFRKMVKHKKPFKEFIDRYIEPNTMTDACYDVVLYGSDQIWRFQNYPGANGYNSVYFGSQEIKANCRIAYSASMGIIKGSEELRCFLTDALSNFSFIGVREKDLYDYIKPLVTCPLQHTIDPVFLLSKGEWLKIIPPNIIGRKYILMLHWQKEAELLPYSAKKASEEKGMELIEIYGFRHSSVICGPLQFLSLIYHAECVFSSSFHGVAFSIIFNTPFYTHLRFNQGRVISILEAFGLKKRFINSVNEITVNEQPDWQDVNQKISMWRDSSVSFLLSSLEHYYKNFSER